MLFWLQTEKKERSQNKRQRTHEFFIFNVLRPCSSDPGILITSFVLRLTKDVYVYAFHHISLLTNNTKLK